MFTLTITTDTKRNLLKTIEDIKKCIEEGYIKGIDCNGNWELKEE